MGKVFITSDTHFNHKNVIEYCKRPFASTEEMNETLIKNWNEVVGPNDIVYHLGDFAFGAQSVVADFVSKLNGTIILIMGNHDRKGIKSFKNTGFNEVYKEGTHIIYRGVELWLTHRPHNETSLFNIHGHVHNDFSHEITNPRCFNACLEQNDYHPVLLNDILSEFVRRGVLKDTKNTNK